jgi:hypothetical protein
MCATMLKLRIRSGGITPASLADGPLAAVRQELGPTSVIPFTARYELKYVFSWMSSPLGPYT